MSTTKAILTGIKGADDFATEAEKLGLTVTIRTINTEATYYKDGDVMLPASLSVSVTVTLPVPEELNGTALGLVERCTSLTSYWNKRDTPRSRGRWTLANYSTLGGHKDMHVMTRMYSYLQGMADDLERLRRFTVAD
jgi:hypothetical protein